MVLSGHHLLSLGSEEVLEMDTFNTCVSLLVLLVVPFLLGKPDDEVFQVFILEGTVGL